LEKIKSEERTPTIKELNPLDGSKIPINEKVPIEEKMDIDENTNQNIPDSSLMDKVIIKKFNQCYVKLDRVCKNILF